MGKKPLTPIEKQIGYDFQYRPTLIKALTHPSAQHDFNWQLLETLGDAVLDLASVVWVLETYREEITVTPGFVTQIRALLVCNRSLARFARDLGLQYQIHTGGKDRLRYRSLHQGKAPACFLALEHKEKNDVTHKEARHAVPDPVSGKRSTGEAGTSTQSKRHPGHESLHRHGGYCILGDGLPQRCQ